MGAPVRGLENCQARRFWDTWQCCISGFCHPIPAHEASVSSSCLRCISGFCHPRPVPGKTSFFMLPQAWILQKGCNSVAAHSGHTKQGRAESVCGAHCCGRFQSAVERGVGVAANSKHGNSRAATVKQEFAVTFPSAWWMASSASLGSSNFTKPNPLGLPVSML